MRPLIALLLTASAALAAEQKPTASVLDPKVTGLPPDEAEILGEAVRDTVVGAGKYRVQDRAAMREILAQQQLNQSEACDESCAVEQGRLLQVRFLISSTARRVGETTWISIRMTDVETGEVTGTTRGSCRCTLEDMVPLAESLTAKVLGGAKEKGAAEADLAATVPKAPPPAQPAPPPVAAAPAPAPSPAPAPAAPRARPVESYTGGGMAQGFRFALGAGIAAPAAGALGAALEAGVDYYSLRIAGGMGFAPSVSASARLCRDTDGGGPYLEAGAGRYGYLQPVADSESGDINDQEEAAWMAFGLVGWRWQSAGGGLFFQLGLGGGYIPSTAEPLGGVNVEVGYSIQ